MTVTPQDDRIQANVYQPPQEGDVPMNQDIHNEELEACRRALQISNARFRNTIENNADGILIVDREGIVRFANAAAGAVFGREAEALIDRDFGFPLVTEGKAEIDLIQGPGETRTAEMRVTPTQWEGEPCRLISLRDITERKQAQQAMEAYAADLARSNAELQRFAFVASHHLQEPLRVITLHLQLLEHRYRDQVDPRAQRSIDYAVAGASHMRALIADLLSYAEVDSGEEAFAPVECAGVLDRTLEALREPIEASGAVVTHGPLPTVTADRVQLRQVFEQLVENAIKFRREGVPPRVHIAADRLPPSSSPHRGENAGSPPAGGMKGGRADASPSSRSSQHRGAWHVSIRDNGIGIDPAYHTRLFELFSRLHTQEAYPGTGIGLALCKKIIARHHGRIWIDSEPGEGTTVHFTLPA